MARLCTLAVRNDHGCVVGLATPMQGPAAKHISSDICMSKCCRSGGETTNVLPNVLEVIAILRRSFGLEKIFHPRREGCLPSLLEPKASSEGLARTQLLICEGVSQRVVVTLSDESVSHNGRSQASIET